VKKAKFEVTDPEGRLVRLATSTWYGHIIIRHREMKQHYEKIKKTIAEPNVITEDPGRDYTLTYSNNELTLSNFYVHVAVQFDDKYEKGDVRTSYITPHLPKGKTIWIRKKY